MTPTRHARRRVTVVAASAVALLLTACGSGASTAGSGSSDAGAAHVDPPALEIKGFAYSPTPITVKAGTAITITNADNQPHTVTSDATGAFDSGSVAAMGAAGAPLTVNAPGTYAFHCSFHPFMHGTLVVQ